MLLKLRWRPDRSHRGIAAVSVWRYCVRAPSFVCTGLVDNPWWVGGYRTLHAERYGEPDSDAGGLGNARCEFDGECSREWLNECESVKDGVCRLESASSVFLED